jgi:flagellin
LQIEANSIVQSINYVAQTSTFKGEQILSGFDAASLGQGTATRTLEDGTVETYTYSLADLQGGGALNLTAGDAEAAQAAVKAAADSVAASHGSIGAREQEIEAQQRALQSELENTSAARSQIEDADYAKETATLVRDQVLQQASLYASALAQDQVRLLTKTLLEPLDAKG